MSTDIAIVAGNDGLPVIRGSLPVEPRDRLRFVSQMSQGECLAGDAVIGVPISVHDWLMHPVELVDEHSGEVVTHLRLVLSDRTGQRISTLSPHVAHAWRLVVQMLGEGPYDPPVRVEIREGRSRKGLEFRTLVVLD